MMDIFDLRISTCIFHLFCSFHDDALIEKQRSLGKKSVERKVLISYFKKIFISRFIYLITIISLKPI